MDEKKKSAEQTALGDELDRILGPKEFKVLGQDLALVIAEHQLTRKPEVCEKVFRYMLIYSYLEAVKGKFIWFIALLQQYSSRTQIENRK